MAKVEGLKEVIAALKAKDKHGRAGRVVVGYSAEYAVHVHENLEVYHRVGQAKYLEQPARQYAGEISKLVRDALAKGFTLVQALFMGGLRLQRESQLLVPVDTGYLRSSAFTRVESEG